MIENRQKIKKHRQLGPPYFSFILVQGVGFEPTNLYRIGS
jgi:hypothetical protein